MAIKVRYRYKVYEGCEEATEKSKKWERAKALRIGIWVCLGFGTMSGANAISQIITSSYDPEMFWPMIIMFAICLPMAYYYVFQSKHVYPTCEELFLASKRTAMNSSEIDAQISAISTQKQKDVKKALVLFSVIYFSIFIALVVFYCMTA